jgi:hypothetical protein
MTIFLLHASNISANLQICIQIQHGACEPTSGEQEKHRQSTYGFHRCRNYHRGDRTLFDPSSESRHLNIEAPKRKNKGLPEGSLLLFST